MKKVLLGLGAAILVAAAGYFGFDFYLQHKVTGQVEAAFAQIRATGAKASHGRVSFDLRTHTVTIADIATESASEPPFSVKIASVTASGVSQLDSARFSADSIDIANAEVAMANEELVRVTFKVPRIVVKAYSGPATVQRLPASASLAELYRFGFEQLASINAASITIPNLTETITIDAKMRDGAIGGDYLYSGIVIEGIKDGKIASAKTDGFHFSLNQPKQSAMQVTADLANMVAEDIDVGALAAVFDASKANDDRDHRIYKHISTGPFAITLPEALSVRIDGMTIDDVGLNPSRLQLPKQMASVSLAGATPPTPAQEREMMEHVANVYEGLHIGSAEMRGFSVEMPQGPVKLQAMRFNLANGKMGEFAIEGAEGRAPNGSVKLGRFALKSLDVANLMRVSAQYPAATPSAEQMLALLPLIEGIEIKALTASEKHTGKRSNIDTFSLNWGQFVGPIPSKMRLIAKISAPVDATKPGQRALIEAGIDEISLDADLGATWTEASRSFALEPVKVDLGGLVNATARLSFANVSREVFSTNVVEAMSAATQTEVGAIELTMRDHGAVDLAIAEFARARNISREAAREAIVESIKNAGTVESLKPAADALINFIETPGQALAIKLTPFGKVPTLQLIQLLEFEPLVALMQFRIEVSAGL